MVRKKYIVIVNGLIGIALGLFLALFIEYFNNMNRTDKEKFAEVLSVALSHFNLYSQSKKF